MGEVSPAVYRAGDGEPLLLLHGFMGTWHLWRPVLADLVPHFEVIAPTLAGHDGGPPFPEDVPHTPAGAAEALERQLDDLGVGDAHVVGNSLGAALALELAKRGRARSVVALAPGGGWEPGSGEPERLVRIFRRQRRRARAAEPRLPAVLRSRRARRIAFRDVMRHGQRLSRREAVEMVRSALRCSVYELVLETLQEGRAHLEALEDVDAPVLLAWPELDRLLPMRTHAARFREEIAGNEFRVLPRLGHMPLWDNRSLVAETILDFARQHAAPPTPAPA